jgi:exosortase/archaeosortase family protein
MTFISLGAAVAFLTARPMWQRLVIVFSAIPIAIFCNVMRVSGQGLIDYYISQQFATGFAHTFYGLVMYIPAFFLLLLVMWILDNLFVDEADEQEKAKLAGVARSKLIVAGHAAKAQTAAGAAAASPAISRPVSQAQPPRKPSAAVPTTATVAARPSASPAVAKPAVKPASPGPKPVAGGSIPAAPAPRSPAAARPAPTAPATTAGNAAPKLAAQPATTPKPKPPAPAQQSQQPKPAAAPRPQPPRPEGSK